MKKTKEKKQKQKSKRSKAKFPNLDRKFNTKIRQLYMDQDYISQLNEKEKQFLNKFMREELNANFTHTSKDLNKSKRSKRKLYSDNNARNRCIFNQLKSNNILDYITDLTGDKLERNVNNGRDYEDSLIDFIDSKKLKKET